VWACRPGSDKEVLLFYCSVDQRGAYVELGAKSPGFCSTSESSSARIDHVRTLFHIAVVCMFGDVKGRYLVPGLIVSRLADGAGCDHGPSVQCPAFALLPENHSKLLNWLRKPQGFAGSG
jgi:hypothetical protein